MQNQTTGVFTLNSYWLIVLITFAVIGSCNCFASSDGVALLLCCFNVIFTLLKRLTCNFFLLFSGGCVSTHVLGHSSRCVHHCSEHYQYLQLWFYIVVFLLLVAWPSTVSAAKNQAL